MPFILCSSCNEKWVGHTSPSLGKLLVFFGIKSVVNLPIIHGGSCWSLTLLSMEEGRSNTPSLNILIAVRVSLCLPRSPMPRASRQPPYSSLGPHFEQRHRVPWQKMGEPRRHQVEPQLFSKNITHSKHKHGCFWSMCMKMLSWTNARVWITSWFRLFTPDWF